MFAWWRSRQRLFSVVPVANHAHWLHGHVSIEDMTKEKSYFLNLAWEKPRKYIRHYGPALAAVTLSHPETIADAMRNGPGKFQLIYGFYKPMLGDGLVTSSGKRWARDHKLLLKAFTQKMLSSYVVVYKSASNTLLDLLDKHVGSTVNVTPFMNNLTFDVVLQCVTGAVTNCQTETDMSSPVMIYEESLKTVLQLIMIRFGQPWLYIDWVYALTAAGRRFFRSLAETQAFTGSLVRARREELQVRAQNGEQVVPENGRDMLDILLGVRDTDGVGLSDDEVREHVDTLLFAGRDTTTSATQWAIFHMAEHPDLQEKCRHEVRQVVSDCGGLDTFDFEHLSELAYLGQFIQETLRYSTVVPNVARSSTRETEVDDVKIAPGTFLQIHIMGVHFNREFWDDPETFNPDRFSPEKSIRHPYAYIPFATGARSCIGRHFALNEMKVVLSMLLLRYRFVADPTAPKTYWKDLAVSRPAPGVWVRLESV